MVQLLRSDRTDLQVLLGEPKAAVRSMFLPFLIAFAVVEANQFIDTFWISGLGRTSAEAISVIVPFFVLLMCSGVGISVGATTTIAFRLGRDQREEASLLASNAMILGLILSVVASVLMLLLLDPALDLLGAGVIRRECWSYFLPMILMSAPMILLSIVGGTLRGEGAARRSTIIQISAALFNMILDPIMIYVLGFGIAGAGIATGLAAAISLAIGLSWYARGRTVITLDRRGFRPNPSKMGEVLNVGGPKTVNEMIAGIMMVIQRIFFIVAGGTAAVMLYNYPWRFISLFMLPGKAFESSMVPVGSAAYGQGDADKMWRAYIYSVKLTVLVSVAAVVIIILFAQPLMSVMTYEPSMQEMLPKLAWILQVSVILLPFMAVRGVSASLLQSMKKARIPMYFDLIWGSVRMVAYALCAYGLLGVDPFDGIIYTMTAIYSLGGVILTAVAVSQFRKFRRGLPDRGAPSL